MPFRVSGLMKADVQSALTDQGYTAARAPKLDQLDAAISSRAAPGAAMALASPYDARLDVAISSRADGAAYTAARAASLDNLNAAISTRAAPGDILVNPANKLDGSLLDAAITSRASGTDYTAARAAKLDNLDAAISSRAAPGATMDLVAEAKTAIWNEAIPGTPTVGSFGERVKNNLDAAITSRASGADYTAARAAKLDNLDAAISSRAAPGAAMALASPYDARLDVAISTRASPTDVDTQLDGKGVTSARMAKLDYVGQSTNSGSVTAAGNTAGLTVQLDTSGVAGQAKSVVEVRYSGGGAATFFAEGSDDGSTWYEGDTFSEAGAATNKLVGYLNTHRYFRFRSPTTGIDLSFEVRALL